MRSGSPGFAQLGMLIAFGIVFAGLFMTTVFFAFVGETFRPASAIGYGCGASDSSRFVYRAPRGFASLPALLLAGLRCSARSAWAVEVRRQPAIARTPGQPCRHRAADDPGEDADRRRAGDRHAGAAGTPRNSTQSWARLQTAWTQLVAEDASELQRRPRRSPFRPRACSERRQTRSASTSPPPAPRWRDVSSEGLSAESFRAAFALLDALAAIAAGDAAPARLAHALPAAIRAGGSCSTASSPRDPNLGAAYITPLQTLTTFAQKEQLRADLEATGVPIQISGWSYTLQDLVPWAWALDQLTFREVFRDPRAALETRTASSSSFPRS